MKLRNLKLFRWLRPDYLIITFFLFGTVTLIGLVSVNLSVLDPFEKALTDFNFSDLLYSKLNTTQEQVDTNIVLVNIGHLNREQIAQQIRRVRSFQPRVIGFDGFFSVPRDSAVDAFLQSQLRENGNLVMACYLTGGEAENGIYDSLETSAPGFNSGIRGFVNLGGANPKVSTVRSFSPARVFRGDTLWAMSADVVRIFDPAAFRGLVKRNNEWEVIHYSGNRSSFISFDADESLDTLTDMSVIRDKIVMMGFMGSSFNTVTDFEDIYYTPMNPEQAGRSWPDMYGVVIHANAAAMILSGDYINVMPVWLSILLSFIFCYFYIHFITWFETSRPVLFDLLFPLILLALNVLIIYIFFILYQHYQYSINATYFLVPILLYETFFTWYTRAIALINSHVRVHPVFLLPNSKI